MFNKKNQQLQDLEDRKLLFGRQTQYNPDKLLINLIEILQNAVFLLIQLDAVVCLNNCFRKKIGNKLNINKFNEAITNNFLPARKFLLSSYCLKFGRQFAIGSNFYFDMKKIKLLGIYKVSFCIGNKLLFNLIADIFQLFLAYSLNI